MTKNDITKTLETAHRTFKAYTDGLSKKELEFFVDEKWSAAQQVEHIYKSVKPLAMGLSLPKWMMKMLWGKANRNSKSYDGLVEKYLDKLTLGAKATKPFVPNKVIAEEVPSWNKKIEKQVHQLTRKLNKFTEDELDLIIVPHPLLGKLTLREMMYFTIYHVQHHQNIIARDLNKMN